jgi:hypothetical protein
VKTFDVPLYGGKVFLYKDRKRFHKAIASYNTKAEFDDVCNGRCIEFYKKNTMHYLVGWFDDYEPTLVHEIGHLAMFVLMRVNMNPTDSGGEAYCYLLAHLYAKAKK